MIFLLPHAGLLFILFVVPALVAVRRSRRGRFRKRLFGPRGTFSAEGPLPSDSIDNYSSNGPALEVSEVGQILLRDPQRQKDLPVHVFYPVGPRPFPVIVFSHGASASGSTYLDLTRAWAAAGYVVLQPTHADSIRLRRQQGAHVGLLRGLSDALKDATANPAAAADRARDISLVLDSLDEIERGIPLLQGKTDRGRIGVGGHSFGGMTALLVGGAVVALPSSPPTTYRDPRVRAIEVLSGPGDREKAGLSGRSWETLQLPMLTMTGSRDLGFGKHPTSWRKVPFDLSPANDKFHVFIEGATHFSFVGAHLPAMLRARVGGAGQRTIFGWIQMSTLAFWDAYLKGDLRAQAWLASDALEKISRNGAMLFRR